MCDLLSWDEIRQRYPNEWVELINYKWDDGLLDPVCGIVRVHSNNRGEFNKLLLVDPPLDSAIVYTGEPIDNPDEVTCCKVDSAF